MEVGTLEQACITCSQGLWQKHVGERRGDMLPGLSWAASHLLCACSWRKLSFSVPPCVRVGLLGGSDKLLHQSGVRHRVHTKEMLQFSPWSTEEAAEIG